MRIPGAFVTHDFLENISVSVALTGARQNPIDIKKRIFLLRQVWAIRKKIPCGTLLELQ